MDVSRSIIIVYYVYINPQSNWRAIVKGQLSDLASYGLMDEADLYVHITDTHRTQGIAELVQSVAKNKAIISRSFVNQFEYPAIKLLYDLASRHSEKVFMYLHTKGMSYNNSRRTVEEKLLLAQTFKNWRQDIRLFDIDSSLNKIGLFPAKTSDEWKGWIWYNFFIVRGSYLKNCEDPLVTDDRYYYEAWIRIANEADPPEDCYSLFTSRKEYFGPEQAAANLNNYIKSRKLTNFTNLLGKFFDLRLSAARQALSRRIAARQARRRSARRAR